MSTLPELPRADALHAQAAQGWLELGNHVEANAELDRISPLLRAHPAVLMLRWSVYAMAKQWEMCIEIGRAVTDLAPGEAQAWINFANSLYFAGQTQAAYDTARRGLAIHPGSWPLHYNLACYACQLGSLDEAREVLAKAIEIGPSDEVRRAALDDSDLGQLWKSA